MCVHRLGFHSKGLIVASVYMDITKTDHSRDLTFLLEYHDRTGADLIISADSNAHSHLWGCQESNKRGEDLERFILQHGIIVANREEDLPSYLKEMVRSMRFNPLSKWQNSFRRKNQRRLR